MKGLIVPVRGRKAKTVKKKSSTTKALKKEVKDVTEVGKLIRSMGGLAGGALGTYFGNPGIGGTIGTGLGAALSKWLGQGDYEVKTNSVLSTDSIPMMHKTGQSIIVRHKEYVGELVGANTFTVRMSLPINPGMAITFPWLAKVANNFQEYTIKGMVYHYVPTSGNAVSSTNPALGSVIFQTSYRASDAPPASKTEMLNEYCANETVPSSTLAHPIECDPNENPYKVQYVRSTAIPADDSILAYDLGKTYVAVSGMPASGNVVGDVWVTYEVELRKPVVRSNTGLSDAVLGAFTCASETNLFETVQCPQDIAYRGTPNNTLALQTAVGADYFVYIDFAVGSPTTTVTPGSSPILVGGSYVSFYGHPSLPTNSIPLPASPASGRMCYWMSFRASEPRVQFTFPTWSVTAGSITGTSGNIVVSKLSQ